MNYRGWVLVLCGFHLLWFIRPPRAPWGLLDSGLMKKNEGLYSPNFQTDTKRYQADWCSCINYQNFYEDCADFANIKVFWGRNKVCLNILLTHINYMSVLKTLPCSWKAFWYQINDHSQDSMHDAWKQIHAIIY